MPGLAPVIRVLAFLLVKRSRRGCGYGHSPQNSFGRALGFSLAAIAGVGASTLPVVSYAQQARLTNLSDVAFGAINTPSIDLTMSQTVCAFASKNLSSRYSITGTGSGGGGAFTLSNGASTLAYEVQWSDAANQTSGTTLTAGSALSGLTSGASTIDCLLGLSPSGSLTIVLRSAALSGASAGNFTGTLSLLISPN